MTDSHPLDLAIILAYVAGSLPTAPDDRETPKNFYLKVRPWGFWGPIRCPTASFRAT